MDSHELYIHRCVELAARGAGYTAPNPMVGAVLVHQDRIIGEGWHRNYGGPHAEVECINSVKPADRGLFPESTMYVSLEPCAHFGKTPPCADLIVREGIGRVVIGCADPFPAVNGKGIAKLRAAGVEVIVMEGNASQMCIDLNRRFFTFNEKSRPYIILKWAETADRRISGGTDDRLHITNPVTNRLVHRWRSEEAALMVGTNTAAYDDPLLDNRHWTGPSPLRVVLDMNLRLPPGLKMFNDGKPVLLINGRRTGEVGAVSFEEINSGEPAIPQVLKVLRQRNILSVLVEGGAKLLQSFIDVGTWDEIRVISNSALAVGNGLAAPLLSHAELVHTTASDTDVISFYKKAAFGK